MGKRNQNTFNSQTARQAGKNRKGIQYKNTRLRKILGIENIEDLKYDILMVWKDLIRYGTKTEKQAAVVLNTVDYEAGPVCRRQERQSAHKPGWSPGRESRTPRPVVR